MSLGGVKQIIYLQNDFTAYMIGNIMYNLANRCRPRGRRFRFPGSEIGLNSSSSSTTPISLL